MTKEQRQLFEFLLLQYVDGKSSPGEEDQLFAILRSHAVDRVKVEEIMEELMAAEPEFVHYRAEEWQKVLNNCMSTTGQQEKAKDATRTVLMRWVGAAAIAVLLALGSIWLLKPPPESATVSKAASVQDVASPVTSAAVLTLSSGKKVLLDEAPDGLVAVDAGTKLVKSADGGLAYVSEDVPATTAQLSYNTITNPRGSKVVSISLSDGTKVWLNTESSLVYPASFAAQERKVEVTGEAYFEVAHNAHRPFIVKGQNMDVQVLGTHFNINNYGDETTSVTTLLEGTVRVTNNGQAVVLTPGQQASVKTEPGSGKQQMAVADAADLKSVVAWKNGLFDFAGAHITNIMRQLSRWYNVDVVFNGTIPERHYTGAIRKSVNLSEVIRMIELAGGVKVTIGNKKIIVEAK